MGKLTDSLKAATQQLSEIKHGINQMQELGQELADNTITVAEAGLRTGYAYAKAEETLTQSQLVSPASKILDAEQLGSASSWTEKALKERFGSCDKARQYLQNDYNICVNRSWKKVVDAFNNTEGDRSLIQKVAELEQAVALQGQYIAVLETKLNEVILNLQQLMSTGK